MASALVFVAEKEKCIHRFTASDTIPGVDHDDLILACNKDPYCPGPCTTDDLGRGAVLYEAQKDVVHRGIIKIERFIRSYKKRKKKSKK